MKPIPYGKQEITDDDINEVINVLKSDFLTQGPKIVEFEKSFASYIGSKYAVAVANGTGALHLSVLALNIKPGDKVITTPITFSASANCVKYCGGDVLFADINGENYLLDLNNVENLLKKEKNVKGIIPVDFAGYPVHLENIKTIANKYGCWILEDACHAPGGFFIDSNNNKQRCGNGNFADLSIFSFHPVKHIATGEGGMITTNNKDLYEKLLLLRTHGITKNPQLMSQNDGGWYMEMLTLGYNYRMPDILAALGISQLKKADERMSKRQEITKRYNEAFKGTSVQIPVVNENYFHAYHLYIIQVENRLGLYNHLRKQNIFAQVHYIPVHTMPYYRQFGYHSGDFPVAENFYKHCLSLPMYPSLTFKEQDFVIDTVKTFLQN